MKEVAERIKLLRDSINLSQAKLAVLAEVTQSASKKKRICDKKTAKKDWIENLVVSKTMETVMNDKLMKDLSNRLFLLQKKENEVIPALNKQLSQTAKSIENMLNAIQTGIFTESTKKRLDQLEEQKNQLEISLLQ